MTQGVHQGLDAAGRSGTYEWQLHPEDDDFQQAGDLQRLMGDEEQERLISSIADSLSQVRREEVMVESIEHSWGADAEFGRRLAEAVAK